MKQRILATTILSLIFHSIIYGQVVETDRGKVEFIGLEQWELNDLTDTLRTISPDRDLSACAADLRYRLGFPAASAIGYLRDGAIYTVITVIEPQNKDRIKYISSPSDTLPVSPHWELAIQIMEDDLQSFNHALYSYAHVLAEGKESARSSLSDWVDKENVEAMWDFLQDHNSPEDHEVALWTLKSDGNFINRIVAIAILANFSEYDLTWWTLANSLRDPADRVSGAATTVIGAMARADPKSVNWEPAFSSLQYLMQGTNLFAYNTVLSILPKTGITRKLATQLLNDDSKSLLLAYLEAENEQVQKYGQSYLSVFLDDNQEKEPDWIETLHRYSNK